MRPGYGKIYKEAARHALRGWSASRSMRHFGFPRRSVAWDAAREGYSDMKKWMALQEVDLEIRAEGETQ